MHSINTLPIRMGVSTTTAGSPDTSQIASTIPADHFSHYHVLGDGDCLFRAMYMGLFNQPGVEPSQDQVMSLRQYLANYVYQHQDTLANNPAFEGRQGVLNLYDLLLTPGQWNHNAGDLVAPLLAQVSGRPLAILQATQEGGQYHVRQVFPAENPILPAGIAHTGEPAICLAHINGNHYGYLEERYPDVLLNALKQRQNNSPQGIQNTEVQAAQKGEPMGIAKNKPGSHRKKLSDQQEQEVVQLWRANPRWGVRRVAREYMNLHPEVKLGKGVVQGLKKRSLDLLGLDLGSHMKVKQSYDFKALASAQFEFQNTRAKLNGMQERALVQLWRANPTWGERKVASEFMKRNMRLVFSKEGNHPVQDNNADLRYSVIGSKSQAIILSQEQEKALLKFWQENPHLSEEKRVQEFKHRHPECVTTKSMVKKLKAMHPELKGLEIGSRMKERYLSDEQEKAAVRLWRENPSWSESRLTQEYLTRNPGHAMTIGVAHRLKSRHQELHKLELGAKQGNKKLSDAQEKDLVELCLANPLWGVGKTAKEFNKRNQGITISPSLISRLQYRYPSLKRQQMTQLVKNVPLAHRSDYIKRQLSILSSQMQRIGPLADSSKQVKSRYNTLQTQYDMFQRSLAHLVSERQNSSLAFTDNSVQPEGSNLACSEAPRLLNGSQEDTSSQGTFAALSDIFAMDNQLNEQDAVDYMPKDDTRSQNTFAALSDIMDVDDFLDDDYLRSDSFDDSSSQGIFDGLEDFEAVSRLRD